MQKELRLRRPIMPGRFSLLLSLILLLAGAIRAQAGPVVIWNSTGAWPGSTAMLFGAGFSPQAQVQGWALPAGTAARSSQAAPSGKATPLEVRQRSRKDCLMVAIPKTWQPGVYALRISTPEGRSSLLYLNRPTIQWWLGDQRRAVSPGAELRLFGLAFLLTGPGQVPTRSEKAPAGSTVQVTLTDAAGKTYALPLKRVDKYALTVTVPAKIALGEAKLAVHNGSGGALGWSEPVGIKVAPAPAWPAAKYNVRDFGARGDGITDDSSALRAALRQAADHGGGVVYLPRGTYKLTEPFKVPARTTVRGDGPEATWLFVPKEVPEFNSVFAGDGDFAIEGLWLTAQSPKRLITAPDQPNMYRMPWGNPPADAGQWAHDVRLQNLLLHHNRYGHRVQGEDPRRMDAVGPSTVALCGPGMDVLDCKIVSAGVPLVIFNNADAQVCRNKLNTGRNGWYYMGGAERTVFEGNEITGRDLEGSYGGFNGNQIARVYIADNRYHDAYGDEREALTFDTPGSYPWGGPVAGASSTKVTGKLKEGEAWKPDSFTNLGCLVAKGTGVGQQRRITGNTVDTLTIERPWDIPLDETSVIAVRSLREEVTIYRNSFEDASTAVQLWAGGHDYLVDGNTCLRTGGIYGTGTKYDGSRPNQGLLPCFFNQFLNNTLRGGFIYQQGPDQNGVLGFYNRTLTAGGDTTVNPVLANVIQYNRLYDHTYIGLQLWITWRSNFPEQGLSRIVSDSLMGKAPVFSDGAGRATLIEGNSVTQTPVGIKVDPCFQDNLIRDNKFTDVAVQVDDWGSNLPGRMAGLKAKVQPFQGQAKPVLWYAFDRPLVKGEFPNLAGNGFSARPQGAVVLEPGRTGQALKFDGTGFLQVGLPYDTALHPLNMPAYTLSCWVKPDSLEGTFGLISRRPNGEPTPMRFSIVNKGLKLEACDTDAKWPFNAGTPDCLTAGQWQQVAMTVDEAKGVDFYVNGKHVGGKAVTGKLWQNMEPLVIGADRRDDTPTSTKPNMFKGLIQEVKVWSRALSPAEMLEEFTASTPH